MRKPVRAIAVIAAKDLRQQLRSGTLLLFGIVLPLGLAFLFNTIMGDVTERFSATYAVVDQDRGPLARGFVEDVLGSVAEATGGDIEIRPVDSAEEGTRLADAGEVSATFVIPAGFSADVEAGRSATLQVIGNVDATIGTQVARAIAEAYATELHAVRLAVAVATGAQPAADPQEADPQEANPQELAARAQRTPPPVTLQADPAAADRVLDSSTYYAAGMAVFFLFFTAMLSVSSILQERSEGTMARLLATPMPRPAILIGKLVAGVGVGLVAMTVLVGTSTLVLGARWGDLRGVAILLAGVVLAATGLMALVATLARTTEQATNWMSVIAVLFGLFGGSFVPLAQFGVLAPVSYVTPHRWFLQGLSDLAGDDSLDVVVVPVAALLGFAVVGFGLALLRVGKVVRL